ATTTTTAGGRITAASARRRCVGTTTAVITATGGALAHEGLVQLERGPRSAAIVRASRAARIASSRLFSRLASVALPPAAVRAGAGVPLPIVLIPSGGRGASPLKTCTRTISTRRPPARLISAGEPMPVVRRASETHPARGSHVVRPPRIAWQVSTGPAVH